MAKNDKDKNQNGNKTQNNTQDQQQQQGQQNQQQDPPQQQQQAGQPGQQTPGVQATVTDAAVQPTNENPLDQGKDQSKAEEKKEPLADDEVIVTATKAFKIKLTPNDEPIQVHPGVQRMKKSIAHHWYAKANGVQEFKG